VWAWITFELDADTINAQQTDIIMAGISCQPADIKHQASQIRWIER